MSTQFSFETTASDVLKAFPNAAKGKTIVITGPSVNSLGAEAARVLAAGSPAHIIFLGRTESKVTPVSEEINKTNADVKTTFIKLDLADNKSVRQCASEINAVVEKIDILILSAGIMAPEKFQPSADGIELQLAACHIGHFLLTGLLLPKLEAAGKSRVVTLTSTGYEVSPFLFDDWNFSEGKTYDRWLGYGQAKSANVLFTRELAKRSAAHQNGITAVVVHPGVVPSSGILQNTGAEVLGKAFEDMKAMEEAAGREFKPEGVKTIEQGAATTVYGALSPDLTAQSGAFLRDSNVVPDDKLREYVTDAEKATKLWAISEEVVKEKFL